MCNVYCIYIYVGISNINIIFDVWLKINGFLQFFVPLDMILLIAHTSISPRRV